MIKKYFENLSIHKLGLISSYISSAIIFMFAVLIINQEYHVYEEKLVSINKEY